MSASLLCSILAGAIALLLGIWPTFAVPTSRRHKATFAAVGLLGVVAIAGSEAIHDRSETKDSGELRDISSGVRQILSTHGFDSSGDTATLLARLRRSLPRTISASIRPQLVAALRAAGPHTVSIAVEENAIDGGDLAGQFASIFHEAGWQVDPINGSVVANPNPGIFYYWNVLGPTPIELAPFLIEMDAAGLTLLPSVEVAQGAAPNGKLLIVIERNPNAL